MITWLYDLSFVWPLVCMTSCLYDLFVLYDLLLYMTSLFCMTSCSMWPLIIYDLLFLYSLVKCEAELIFAMDKNKQNALSLLDRRKRDAEALRVRTIGIGKLRDEEVQKLKGDIKVCRMWRIWICVFIQILNQTSTDGVEWQHGSYNSVLVYVFSMTNPFV